MFAASTTTSFSYSGTFADNSHYSYTYSYTSFQPSSNPATIPYDAYFSELASRELGRQMQLPLPYGNMNDSLPSFHGSPKAVPRYLPDRTGPRIELLEDIDEDRIEELSMKPISSYTGKARRDSAVSIAPSSASSRTMKPSAQQQQRRKMASRANTYPLPLPLPPIPQPMHSKNNSPCSDTSTSAKRSSKRRQQDWALVEYPTTPSARRSEVGPEDSISQASSSGRRSSAGSRYQYVPPEERRGRTRTRSETWESVGSVRQQQQPPSMMMMQQPVPSGKFETRVITPGD